jgi:hypothetical protein
MRSNLRHPRRPRASARDSACVRPVW